MDYKEALQTMEKYESLREHIAKIAGLYLGIVYKSEYYIDNFLLRDIEERNGLIYAIAEETVEINDHYEEGNSQHYRYMDFSEVKIFPEWLTDTNIEETFKKIRTEKETQIKEITGKRTLEREEEEKKKDLAMLKELMEKYPEVVKGEKK